MDRAEQPARDRDAAGRPRNARPRDGLGRPLPHGATGVPRVPDDLVLAPRVALVRAQRLLDAGLPFHAHEVLEGSWKAAPPDERDLWQGLAQLAVGLTHLLRGNRAGAAALLARGAGRLRRYAADPPHGVDVPGLLAWAATVRARLQDGEPPDPREPPDPLEDDPREPRDPGDAGDPGARAVAPVPVPRLTRGEGPDDLS